jgi:hypothetical protein
MTGAAACGSMPWVWPGRMASRALGRAAAAARAALRRNGGLFSPQMTRAGIRTRAAASAGSPGWLSSVRNDGSYRTSLLIGRPLAAALSARVAPEE